MQPVEKVRAVPGRGLEGDRYFYERGSYSRWPGPHREVTLFEVEKLDEMAAETGVRLDPVETRRNILVQGFPLNDFIKRTFYVGPVKMAGIR